MEYVRLSGRALQRHFRRLKVRPCVMSLVSRLGTKFQGEVPGRSTQSQKSGAGFVIYRSLQSESESIHTTNLRLE